MKKTFVKVLSFVMVLAMLTSMAATFAFAAEAACPGYGNTHTDTTNATSVEVVAPVCDEYGYTIYQCNECNDYFMADFVAPNGDAHHELEEHAEVPAECEKAGTIAYSQCTLCEKIFVNGEVYTGDLTIEALEHDYVLDEEQSTGSCVVAGELVYVCSHCGDVKTEDAEGTGEGHKWELVSIDTDPSVDADNNIVHGSATYKCTECGAEESFDVICKHDYEIQKDADNHWNLCAVCGHVDGVTAHNWDAGVLTPDSTCTEPGNKIFTCDDCGQTKEETVDEKGHAWDAGVETTAPTCTEDGVMTFTCTACGETKTEAIAALGHAWDDGVETTAPTCTEEGVKTFTCGTCGETRTETLPVRHGEIIEAKQDATCTMPGLVASMCKDCNAIIGEATVIPATGHTARPEGIAPVIQATCTIDGRYEWNCGNCGALLIEKIDATGHNEVLREVLATCSTYKYTYTYCTNENCTDAQGVETLLVETVTIEGVVYDLRVNDAAVKLLGAVVVDVDGGLDEDNHSALKFREVFVEADCTHKGTALAYCENCPWYEGSVVEIPALGHSWEREEPTWETPVLTPPTCTEWGYYTYGCVDCDATTTEVPVVTLDESLAPLGHTEETIPAVAPGCEATGWTEGTKCSECGAILVAPTVVEATGHAWGEKTTVVPKCDGTPGYDLYVCANAGCEKKENYTYYSWNDVASNTYYSVDEANKIHDLDANAGTELRAMSCKTNTDGLYTYVCADCGKTILVTIKAEHAWGTEQVEIPATCTTPGTKAGKECTVCGAKEGFEEIPALGHTEEVLPAVDATCTEIGWTEGTKCSVCGEILVAQEEIPALGHNWNTEINYDENNHWYDCLNECGAKNEEAAHNGEFATTLEPTCTEVGTKVYTCDCGYTYDEEIPALGHDFQATGVTSVLGCETDNYTEYSCTLCKIMELRDYLPAHGHDVVIDEAVEPDCDDTGLTEGNHCTYGCDSTDPAVNKAQEVIPATGKHYNAAGEELLDVCTNANVEDRVCVTCNDSANNVIGLTHHETEKQTRKVEPTCTSEGYTIVFCGACQAILDVVEPTAPVPENHVYGEWVETTAPTCTEKGVETLTCVCCGHTETRDVDALGHNYGPFLIQKAPTCTEAGAKAKTCKTCGDVVTESIPATGHTAKVVYSFDDAQHWFDCATCGVKLEATVADHNWVETETIVEAAPAITGEYKHECTVCDAEKIVKREYEGVKVSFDYTSGIVDGASVVNGGLVVVKVYLEGTRENLENVQIKFNYDASRLTWIETNFGGDLVFDIANGTVANGKATLFLAGDVASANADSMVEIHDKNLVATLVFCVDDYADVLEGFIPVNAATTYITGIDAAYTVINEETENEIFDCEVPAEVKMLINKIGAVSSDMAIDGLDVIALKDMIAAGDYMAEADINRDTFVDAMDYILLAQYLGGAYTYEEFVNIGA